MELGIFLNSLRDPAGLPFYPIVFQFLMVLTFSLHIILINAVFGGLIVAGWEICKGDGYGALLGKAIGKASTIMLSIAIVLGVAPLLFVQVIYDPFWYAANTMSALWAMFFLIVVCAAFYGAYGFYLGNKGVNTASYMKTFWLYVAIISMALSGILIHTLTMESLMPEKWLKWVMSEDLGMLTGGARLHGISIGRLMHFFFSSFAVCGVFLMLYSWYFYEREDIDKAYLDYVASKGANLTLYGTLFSIGAGFWWAGTVPQDIHFIKSPLFLIAVILSAVFMVSLGSLIRRPRENAIKIACFLFLVVFVMSYLREFLRMGYLGHLGYSIFSYKLNISWESTILFFATFIMGIAALIFPVAAAFKAGRAKRDEIVRIPSLLPNLTNALLIGWLLIVVGIGIVISLKNGTLF